MLRLGYDRSLAIGVCCAGGALGTMVPPSIVLIIYGLTASVSIGDLFTASFLPGLMLASFYMAYVLVRAYLDPVGRADTRARRDSARRKAEAAQGADPADHGGDLRAGFDLRRHRVGNGGLGHRRDRGVILSTVLRGEFTLELIVGAARRTLATVGMIVWIGIGASALVGVFNLMGGIDFVSSLLTGISENPTVIVLVMMAILFVLGMFLDWVGIALLTMPIFVPIVRELGLDPVWFGVVFAMNMQVSFLSPPFGPAAFYLKSVTPPDISLGEIFRSLLPFIGLQIVALGLLITFPGITGRF